MSQFFAHFRILAVTVVFSVGAMVAGCSGGAGDPGADRSQQQSKQLQDRINTTQVDR